MAELTGLPIPCMDWHALDLPHSLKKFKALCELMFTGPLADKDEAIKVKYLLIWSGEDGIELVSTWNLTEDNAKKLNSYWTGFEHYVSPKSNFRSARYKLRDMKQESTETIDSFVKRIRLLAGECQYADRDEQIIDAIIFGVNNRSVATKLMKEGVDLTVTKALDIARIEEITRRQVADISGDSRQVHTVGVQRLTTQKYPGAQRGKSRRGRGRGSPQLHARHPSTSTGTACGSCGRFHAPSPKEACPAYGTTCTGCGKRNHWKPVCRSAGRGAILTPQQRHKPRQHIHTLETTEEENLYFDSLDIHKLDTETETEALVELLVKSEQCSKMLTCKPDTGAQGNAIPICTFKSIHPHSQCTEDGIPVKIKPSKTKITAYGDNDVMQYGECNLQLTFGNLSHSATFHVVKATGPVILGLPTCRALNLVTLNYALGIEEIPTSIKESQVTDHMNKPVGNQQAKNLVLKEYADCFQGIGCFKGEYHIILDKNTPPVIHPPRRIPVALKESLGVELQKLEKQNIIAKVHKPTDWVNSFVCTTKSSGGIRLCLDPKDLNKAIKRPHHFTPTLDDILPKLSGAKYFSILDARSGYWNIKLDEESSYYTTFNTPSGRYRFLRLPFGLVCAQDVFQKKVDETFGDLPGVTGIADDIVIVGYKEDGSDHDANLRAVLDRARSTGIKLNPDKMHIKCQRITFFGNVIGAKGLEPDSSKVEAIQNMQEPNDLKELQTFLGLANYLSRFTPHLSSLSAPLRDLCKQDSEFRWGPEHTSAFQSLKKVISSPTVLKYYDSTKPLVIQVDASQRGLGAALLQPDGAVAFASKSLTETEQRYSNIEREMLGIVFGLERFHYYAYGRPVTIETDHKPLESIYKKNLVNAPPRLARMLLRIQKYDITIKYIPGKDIALADALSRVQPCPGGTIKNLDISVHEIRLHLNASATRLEQIKEETDKDNTLLALRELISLGWPKTRTECPTHLHDYWNYREELSCSDGLILKGTRIIIPKSLRPEALRQIHYAHQGSEKCKLRARGSVFWCGINKDIDEMVKSCPPCQKHQSANHKEIMIPHDVPQRPWHTIGTDLFQWNNNQYLLLVDYYSKFPILRKLKNITSSAVITQMKGIFDEHGIPEKVVSDGGTQYTSMEFKIFSQLYGFSHITSSPHYPQSNGLSERNVQTMKNLLQKALETGSDPHLAMICYRATPLDHNTPSPSEMLNSRKYKTNLPVISSRNTTGHINEALQFRQDTQQSSYNRNARPLSTMDTHESIRAFNPRTHVWEPAKVLSLCDTPRSYLIQTENGAVYRRNRRHLRKTGETFDKFQPTIEVDDETLSDQSSDMIDIPMDKNQENSVQQTSQPVRRSGRTIKKPERLDL